MSLMCSVSEEFENATTTVHFSFAVGDTSGRGIKFVFPYHHFLNRFFINMTMTVSNLFFLPFFIIINVYVNAVYSVNYNIDRTLRAL